MTKTLRSYIEGLNTAATPATPFLDNRELAAALGVTGKRKTLKLPSLHLPYAHHQAQADILEKAITRALTARFADPLSELEPTRILLSVGVYDSRQADGFRASEFIRRKVRDVLADDTWLNGRIDFVCWVQENNPLPDTDWQRNETRVRQVVALWFAQAHHELSSLVNAVTP